eukprot:Opistho-2@56869
MVDSEISTHTHTTHTHTQNKRLATMAVVGIEPAPRDSLGMDAHAHINGAGATAANNSAAAPSNGNDILYIVDDYNSSAWIARDFSFAACYFLIAIVSLVMLVRSLHRSGLTAKWSTQKLFMLLTCIQTFSRTLFFTLSGIDRLQLYEGDRVVMAIFSSIPVMVYFSSFTVILFFWAQLYHFANGQSSGPVVVTSIFCNIVFYLTGAIYLCVLFGTDMDNVRAMNGYSYAVAVYAAFLALAFLLYGWRMYRVFDSITERIDYEGESQTTKVLIVTFTCIVSFTARAAFLFTYTGHLSAHLSASVAYFVICELAPTVAMVAIFRRLPDARNDGGNGRDFGGVIGGTTPSGSTLANPYSTFQRTPAVSFVHSRPAVPGIPFTGYRRLSTNPSTSG